jgi:cytolysin-activating lysine-acyltransferase
MIGDVLHLMLQSDVHRKWYVHDLERLIMPAIEAGKMKVFYEDGKPQGLYSHAFLTPEAAKGYLMKTRKLQPEDWFTDHESGTLFLIDLIAPYGNVLKIGRMVQKDLTDRYIDVYMKDGAFMKRVAKNDRLMYVTGVKDMLDARRAEHEVRA